MSTSGTPSIEDICPLSPIQRGILAESIAAGPEMYVQQFVHRIEGDLVASHFRAAWEWLVQRHAILRTGFVWQGRSRPLQVVFRRTPLSWKEEDLRGLDPDLREARAGALIESERAVGFALGRPPLLRLALVRTGDRDWLLVSTNHHLVMDGWSRQVLLREVLARYEDALLGRPTVLPPAPPYAAAVAWLRRLDDASADAYWQGVLAGFREPTVLPDLGGGAAGEEARREVLVLTETGARLRERARDWRLTLSTLMHGAWALMLAGGAGSEDVVFGTTLSGRLPELHGVEGIAGPFVNTLPVRVKMPPDARLHGWLEALQAQFADLGQHQHLPLARVRRWADVPRRCPLFESVVDVQPFWARRNATADGGVVLHLAAGRERTGIPLVAAMAIVDPPLLRVEADAARSSQDGVRALASSLRRLLDDISQAPPDTSLLRFTSPAAVTSVTSGEGDRSALASPMQRLSRVPRARRAAFLERLREIVQRPAVPPQVNGWAYGPAAPPPDITIARRFEQIVRERADAEAVRLGERALTYGALNLHANRLAHLLRRLGVGAETLVGIHLRRGMDMVVAVLAVLKAGGAYVPLERGLPPERLAFMIRDAGIRVVVSNDSGTDPSVTTITLDGAEHACLDEPENDPDPIGQPWNLAYLLYTSGSTGTPKGALIAQASVVDFVYRIAAAYEVRPGVRLLGFAPLSFDVSVFELFTALLSGATLCLAGDEERYSHDRLQRLLREQAVEVAELPPALMPLLRPDELPALRLVSVGGEPPAGGLVEPWTAGGRRFVNGYGPTEATVAVTLMDCRGRWTRTPPIGRPMARRQTWVLDGDMNPVEVGVPGELYIGGPSLARGYHRRPGVTAERFLPDPHGSEAGARLYRTGDRARWLADGNLEFLGRLDRQVRLRGNRMELGELEARLREHPGVEQAAVEVVDGGEAGRQLVAYVTGAGAPDLSGVREHLGRWVAAAVLPTRCVRLERLPLTPNGKLDRRALPAPPGEPSEVRGRAPETPIETRVAELVCALLGFGAVGADDDFFELGGDSLQATQLMSRVRESLGAEVSLADFWERPTVANLAELVTSASEQGSAGEEAWPAALRTVEELPDAEVQRYPLTHSQQALWRLGQVRLRSDLFHVALALRLSGDLDAGALGRAFGALARRHGALRTIFPGGTEPVQVSPAGAEPAVDLIDLRALPPAERDAEALRLIGEGRRQPFDLARGPALRVQLLRLGERDHGVQWVSHHLLTDAWSVGVQLRELPILYRAEVEADGGKALPAPPLQFAEFARHQHQVLVRTAVATHRETLLAAFRDAPRSLPTPFDLPAPDAFRPGYRTVAVPESLAPPIRELARTSGATLSIVFVAALAGLVGRLCRVDDVLLLMPAACRTRRELEDVVGFFVNRVPVRMNLSGDPTFDELVARARRATTRALVAQEVPFELLAEWLAAERGDGGPEFSVLFSMQNTPQHAGAFPGVKVVGVMPDDSGLGFNPILELYSSLRGPASLSLLLRERPGGVIAGGLEFDAARFSEADAEGLERGLWSLLTEAARDGGQRLSRVSPDRWPSP